MLSPASFVFFSIAQFSARPGFKAIAGLSLALLSASCGDGGSGGSGSIAPPSIAPPVATTLGVDVNSKQLRFSWPAVSAATYYRLYENPNGVSGYLQIGGDLTATAYAYDIAVHRLNWPNARYLVEACNTNGCTASSPIGVSVGMLAAIGYVKPSNTHDNEAFGDSVAVSGDGNTLAVGASSERTAATGIDGNANNDCNNPLPVNCAENSGAVYVYVRNPATGVWAFQAYIKASNTGAEDRFGGKVALSRDGNTLAVGAIREDSAATGIDGDQTSNAAINSGAVYVFTRSGSTWTQQAYIKSSNSEGGVDDNNPGDQFGISIGLSADGNTLAVGAGTEDSAATGINGDQTSNAVTDAGAVYVFTRSGPNWNQQAYIKASNNGVGYNNYGDRFGYALALSGDGNTLAVGAYGEDSAATGINGDQTSNAGVDSGAAYVFTRSGGVWSQQSYIKASNAEAGDQFGAVLSLSNDGDTLAVGTGPYGPDYGEDGALTGVFYDPASTANTTAPNEEATNPRDPPVTGPNTNILNSGAVYVFTHSGTTWEQNAYIKASNTGAGDRFGYTLALSGDGQTLAVGANLEDSNAVGVNGEQSNNLFVDAGAVYIYTRVPNTSVLPHWTYASYVKASNSGQFFRFGGSVALSDDGATLAVGTDGDDTAATGVGGNQTNDCSAVIRANCSEGSGAVYLY